MKTPILLTFVLLGLLVINSCRKESGDSKETKISSAGSNNSHNMGQNCMTCHKSGGQGEGVFTIAGTVYDSLKTSTLATSTIKLYTQPNGTGTLKYTIQVDGKGNFYTTENIDFGAGLYPAAS